MKLKSNLYRLGQRGFTLVEALVGMVMITAGMVAMVTVSDIQGDSNKRVRFRSESAQFIKDVHLLLENDGACRSTILRGGAVSTLAGLDAAIQTLSTADNTPDDPTDNGLFVSAGNTYGLNNSITITRIRMTNAGYAWPPVGSEYAFNLVFDIDPTAASNDAISTLTKSLPEPIYLRVEGGVVVDCLTSIGRMQEEIRRESCESVGGTFERVDPDRDIWCTFPGLARVPVNDPDNTVNQAVARDYVEGRGVSNPFGVYLQTDDPSGSQTVNGPMTFNQVSSSSNNGIIVNSASIGGYPAPGSAAILFSDFESAVPNYDWLTNNYQEMLRHRFGNDYCDEDNGFMLMITSAGAQCIPSNDLVCPSGEYLSGIQASPDSGGSMAYCVPLVNSASSNCPQGGYLQANATGGIDFVCFTSCTAPAAWRTVGSSCSCASSREEVQICETPCGGTCPGGGIDGDTRTATSAPGTCTPPPACSGGAPSGTSCAAYSGFDYCGSTCLGKPLLTPAPDSCCSSLADYPGPNAPCE